MRINIYFELLNLSHNIVANSLFISIQRKRSNHFFFLIPECGTSQWLGLPLDRKLSTSLAKSEHNWESNLRTINPRERAATLGEAEFFPEPIFQTGQTFPSASRKLYITIVSWPSDFENSTTRVGGNSPCNNVHPLAEDPPRISQSPHLEEEGGKGGGEYRLLSRGSNLEKRKNGPFGRWGAIQSFQRFARTLI